MLERSSPGTSSQTPAAALQHPPRRVRELVCPRAHLTDRYEALLLDEVESYIRAARRSSADGKFECVDLGGFPGVWARVVATKFPMVSAYSYDKLFLRAEPVAVRLRTRGAFRPLDIGAERLPHGDHTINIASMLFVSHFLSDAALSHALSELHRVLCSGALFIHAGLHPKGSELPHDLGPHDQQVLETTWLGASTHVHLRGSQLMERLFAAHGFTNSQTVDLHGADGDGSVRIPFTRISILRKV